MAIFRQTPPQQFLDELHDADVPGLFDPNLTKRERADAIQAAKRKIARAKARLEEERDLIRNRYAVRGSKRDKEIDDSEKRLKIALAPYMLLFNLTRELEEQIQALENALGAGKLLPEGFHFGDRIFGNAERGEWFLGNRDDEELWAHAERVRQQLEEFMKQREPLVTKQKQIKERTAKTQQLLKEDTRKLKRRSQTSYIGFRLFILLIIAVGLMGFGYYRAQPFLPGILSGSPTLLANSALWLFIMGAGFALLLSIPYIYARWRRNLHYLEDRIAVWRRDLEELQHDAQIIQRDYIPVNDKCRQLHAEYQELRAHFSAS